MDQEIKDFVLVTLNREYSNLGDDLYRAERQQMSTPDDSGNNSYVESAKKRVEVARKALAYFGFYR